VRLALLLPRSVEQTEIKIEDDSVTLYVGDSQVGSSRIKLCWNSLVMSSFQRGKVQIDLSDVRPAGEDLKGLGRC